MTTTIRLSKQTKEILNNLGGKGMSYEDIILNLFHDRNIFMIHNYFKDDRDLSNKSLAEMCFRDCGIPLPETFNDCGLNGDGIIPFTEEIFDNCCEMATDEDLVGSNRNPTDAEIVTNIYCLCWDIPAPTWSLRRRNPCGV